MVSADTAFRRTGRNAPGFPSGWSSSSR